MFKIHFAQVKKPTGLAVILLLIAPGLTKLANAEVAGFTGSTFAPPPTVDIVVPGAINSENDIDFDITNTTELRSFTTRFGTTNTIAGPTRIENVITSNFELEFFTDFDFTVGEDSGSDLDSIRNFWGFEGSEIDGGDSLLGLDVSAGLGNAVTFDAFFGVTLDQAGAPGLANDIFIMETNGNDSIRVFPLNEEGNPIGDFALEINSGPGTFFWDYGDPGDWGNTGVDINAFFDFSSGDLFDDLDLVGVAFDLSDFQGTGTLTDVAGVRIQGTDVNSGTGNVDATVVGYNTSAVQVPEHSSPFIFGFVLVSFFAYRTLYSHSFKN
jgi:hypothetical protein